MMEFWKKLATPPDNALKQIQAGRLKGKSDINPQWRYEVMTQVFGVCGFGWWYDIIRLWTEPGDNGQIMAFAQINLYVKVDGEVSRPIPATGGSMAIENERNGAHSSDECYKMAITDALGTAMKMLGVAADIYRGTYDGSKYQKQPTPVHVDPVQAHESTVFNTKTSMQNCRKALTDAGMLELAGQADAFMAELDNGKPLMTDRVKVMHNFMHEMKFKLNGGAK